MTEPLRPRVGLGVLITKNGKVLLGKRKGAHGSGTWAPPGGKLDFGEEVEDSAKREVLEETGLQVKNIKFLTFTNDIFRQNNLHYVTLWLTGEYTSGKPKVMESNKCEQWDWFDPDKLPKPLFNTLKNLLKSGFKITAS